MHNRIRSIKKSVYSNPIYIDKYVSYPASTLHGLILDEPYLWREAQLHPLAYLAPDILGLGLEPLNGHLLPPLVSKHGHEHLAHLRTPELSITCASRSSSGRASVGRPDLEVVGELDVGDGGEGGEVAVGAERGLGEDRALQDGVAREHVGELPLDLLCHHPHPPLLRHAPHRAQRRGRRPQRRRRDPREGESTRRWRRQRAARQHRGGKLRSVGSAGGSGGGEGDSGVGSG
jgi:hypothetical protein